MVSDVSRFGEACQLSIQCQCCTEYALRVYIGRMQNWSIPEAWPEQIAVTRMDGGMHYPVLSIEE